MVVVVVGWGGVVGSYPLLSQAPTPVEVELRLSWAVTIYDHSYEVLIFLVKMVLMNSLLICQINCHTKVNAFHLGPFCVCNVSYILACICYSYV